MMIKRYIAWMEADETVHVQEHANGHLPTLPDAVEILEPYEANSTDLARRFAIHMLTGKQLPGRISAEKSLEIAIIEQQLATIEAKMARLEQERQEWQAADPDYELYLARYAFHGDGRYPPLSLREFYEALAERDEINEKFRKLWQATSGELGRFGDGLDALLAQHGPRLEELEARLAEFPTRRGGLFFADVDDK